MGRRHVGETVGIHDSDLPIKENDHDYGPINPIAKFTDRFGNERIIHRPKNGALRVFCGAGTPILKMNRAVARLIGRRVKSRRKEIGISQRETFERAAMVGESPKQRIHAIENARRGQGMRIGSLYALAFALDCTVDDLLPPLGEVMEAAGVAVQTVQTIKTVDTP